MLYAAPVPVSCELRILGSTNVRVDGVTVPLRPRERDVLAALALAHPHPSPVEDIAEVLWPDDEPASAKVTIQNHVARIRRALGADAVLTDAGGYRLGPTWSLDIATFAERVARGRRRAESGDTGAARLELQRARELVRGEAYADLDDGVAVAMARSRHRALVAAADEELLLALLAAGEVHAAIAEARAQVEQAPTREARWAALALALYRGGERRESLRVLHEWRAELRDQSGIDAGPVLARLESLILVDHPSLVTAPPATLTGHRPGPVDTVDVFVGREAELELVRRLLADAHEHRGARLLVVDGEAGIGKTAFLERVGVQAADAGWHVVAATCPAVATRPLEPLGDLVRQVLDHEPQAEDAFDADLLADLATLWRSEPGPVVGDLGEAVIEALAGHAERHPTVVVVDDAHHLSATARELLQRLSTVEAPLAVVLALVATPAVPVRAEDRDGVVVTLRGLSPDESRRLVELMGGGELTDLVAAAMHAATAGSPARLRAAARRASDDPDDALGTLLLDALAALEPGATELAEVLVVAAMPLPLEVLGAVLPSLGSPGVTRVVRRAIDAGVLTSTADGRVAPSDRRLDQALHGRIPPERIDSIRERVGAALLDAGHVLAAAPHLLAVADVDPPRAIATAVDAAREAAAATMHVEAAQLLDRAADVAGHHFGRSHRRYLELRLGQAEMLRRSGDPGAVPIAWDVVRAAEALGDSVLVAHGAAGLCSLGPRTEAGTLDEELADLVERAVLGCDDPAARALCAAQATLFYSMSGRVDRCSAHFEEALASARRTGDPQILLAALGVVYIALTHPDELERRERLAEELLAVAERIDDDDARFQALHLYFSNQVQRADPLLRTTFVRQETLTARLRTPQRRWMVGYQRACLAHLDGRLDDVVRISEENLATAPVGRSRAMTTYWMAMLVVSLARGEEQELAGDIDRAIAAQPGLPGWRAVAAWVAARRGDAERVRHECEVLGEGRALPRDMTWGGALMLLGRAVAACGDRAAAASLADRLRPFSGLMTWYGSGTVGPFDLALAELALALDDRATVRHHLDLAWQVVGRLRAVVFEPELRQLEARLG